MGSYPILPQEQPDPIEQERQRRQGALTQQVQAYQARMQALNEQQAQADTQRRQMGQAHLADLTSRQQQLEQRPSLKQTVMQLAPTAISTALGAGFEGAEGAASALQGGAEELGNERTYKRSLLDKLQQQTEAEKARQESEEFQAGERGRSLEQQTLAESMRTANLGLQLGAGDARTAERTGEQDVVNRRNLNEKIREFDARPGQQADLERLKQGNRVQLQKMKPPPGGDAGAAKEADRQSDLKSQYAVVQNNINALAQPDIIKQFDKPGVGNVLYQATSQIASHVGAYVPGIGAFAIPAGNADVALARLGVSAADASKLVDAYNAAVEGAAQYMLITQGGRIGRSGSQLFNVASALLPGPRTTTSKQAMDQLGRFQDQFDIWKKQHPQYGGAAGPSFRDTPLKGKVTKAGLVDKYAGQ